MLRITAHSREGAASHDASELHNLVVAILGQNRGHVQCRCDYRKAAEPLLGIDLACEILDGSARCDDNRVVGLDKPNGRLADGGLLGGILRKLHIHVAVVDVGAHLDGLSVSAVEAVALFEQGEVFTNRNLRDVEHSR